MPVGDEKHWFPCITGMPPMCTNSKAERMRFTICFRKTDLTMCYRDFTRTGQKRPWAGFLG